MTMTSVSAIGVGGSTAGLHEALVELQGLKVTLVAGGLANAKLDVAAIRPEDTIISAINNNAGTLTDITNTVSIVSVNASGTVTVGTATAGDTVTVNGKTYTLVANDATVSGNAVFSSVRVGADADGCAANLADAINRRELHYGYGVTASAASNVVTVTAVAEGTAGNSIALAETGSSFTVSGATLSGGTATGGIKSTGATDQVILYWFNKR